MNYKPLGHCGLTVSRLCFGALTMGPLQVRLTPAQGGAIIRRALECGVNFIDTAELYDTYTHIRQALRGWSQAVVIVSKSYAWSAEQMEASFDRARRALDRDVLEIFLLHEQESALTLAGHRPALEWLLNAKAKGLLTAVGISTHHVAAVKAATEMAEIDVIHTIINEAGIGIADGGAIEMYAAIEQARQAGKGIYAMKALGGGHLLAQADRALKWVLEKPAIDSIAVGMQSISEVEYNCRLFDGQTIGKELAQAIKNQPRRLIIDEHCNGCGECVARCKAGALQVIDGQAICRVDRCRLCGYCASVCRDFCLKVI